MTKYKCRKKPSGLYDVTVMTPEGGRTTVRDMTPARKQNLIRIIREFNTESERQRAVEQGTRHSQQIIRWKDYIRNEKITVK